jgi:hypothetical protein
MNLALAAPVVPVAPAGGGVVAAVAGSVAVVPVVPAGLAASPGIGGAAFRQPVTVILSADAGGVVDCGVGGCAGV